MSWIKELFQTEKPIIAMCHLKALPGDPGYDPVKGMAWIVEMARADLRALQEGGVDAVMFSNEASLPYLTKVEPITTACMARVIAELHPDIRVPFGVNVLWDPTASIDLAVATGGQFVREIFSGVYASDYGLWNTNCGEIIRHQHAVHARHVKLFFNIVPESAAYLAERHVVDIAKSTVFVSNPDALCVSGLTAGAETPFQTLQQVKSAVPETPVFANTGVRASNVAQMLSIADGAIVGTTFKRDGYIWHEVDVNRVREFMGAAKEARR
ncbi:MAG: sgc region protein SgcQ [Chloroflexota bacterium]|nr:MAG: sgc region protein SgcQ [Chloroflexota bacterium]